MQGFKWKGYWYRGEHANHIPHGLGRRDGDDWYGIGEYINGKKTGCHSYFHSDGSIDVECDYIHGVRQKSLQSGIARSHGIEFIDQDPSAADPGTFSIRLPRWYYTYVLYNLLTPMHARIPNFSCIVAFLLYLGNTGDSCCIVFNELQWNAMKTARGFVWLL